MCSSPKSKRSLVTAKKVYSGSMLSNVSTEARSRFAQNANKADERRYLQQQQLKQQKLHKQNKNVSLTNLNKSNSFSKQTNKAVFYWLFQASFKEIIHLIFFSKNQLSGKTKI